MTLQYPEAGDASSDSSFEEANALFQRAVGALDGLVKRIQAGELEAVAETDKAVKHVDGTLKLVMQERLRLEERQRKDAGIAHGFAIDFDAARHEIGRRLACIRSASGAEEVS